MRRASPEKAEELKAHKLMATLGFTAWRLSQSRATRQTPGWPDILFTHPEHRLAVYYEAKAANGKQSAAQKEFQRHITHCGHDYVVGTVDALAAWCQMNHLLFVLHGGGWQLSPEALSPLRAALSRKESA